MVADGCRSCDAAGADAAAVAAAAAPCDDDDDDCWPRRRWRWSAFPSCVAAVAVGDSWQICAFFCSGIEV